MADLDDPPLPTPCDGWEVATYAFDQDRDPNKPDGPAAHATGHGRVSTTR